jgi:hypothetical protein
MHWRREKIHFASSLSSCLKCMPQFACPIGDLPIAF